jgi:autotransporter-associated beta strand protein
MPSNWWSTWTNRKSKTLRARHRRPSRARLSLEALEDRLTLSAAQPVAVPQYLLTHGGHDGGPQNSSSPVGLLPSQIRQAYGMNQLAFGNVAGDGTGQTIAIVDAYDNPNIQSDLHAFDQQFGMPDPTFTKVAQDGSTNYPPPNPVWISEIDLDVQWAHVTAPGASILLVEANDSSFTNLNTAVQYAASQPGVAVVSMSWGYPEVNGDSSYDPVYTTPTGHPGVTFLAATGDNGQPGLYPAISPNVVAVGGTTLTTDAAGDYLGESGWSGSGGGISLYEPQPPYQKGVVTQSTTQRTTPDVAMIGGTGVAVYQSYGTGSTPWTTADGTSLGTPLWAGLVTIADQGLALNHLGPLDGPNQTLPALYQLPATDFHDITTGNNGFPAGPGYDLVTGRGTPIANLVVPDLVQAPVIRTWTGGGPDANWSDPLNWAGGVAPNPGDTLVFGPGASQLSSTDDYASGTTFSSIRFTGAGYTFGGNDLTLTQGINAEASTGANTLNDNVTFSGTASISAGGKSTSLTLGGNLNNAGNTLLVGGSLAAVTVTGAVSGSGGLINLDTGTLQLSGTNTYSGGTTVSGGVLTLGGSSPLGTGTLVLNGGTVQAIAGGATLPNAVTLGGNITIAGSNPLTFSGAATLSGSLTLTVNTTTTFSGGIGQSATAALTKAGNGVLVLSAPDSYSGGTTLAAGTLQVGDPGALGSGTLTVNNGTLSGTGSALTIANPLTLSSSLTVGGNSALTFSGPVTLTSNLNLAVSGSATATLSGAVGQSGGTWGLTKNSGGLLVLSGNNTFGGNLTLNGGTLQVNNAAAAGTGTLTIQGGTFLAGAPLTISNAVALGGSPTLAGTSALTFAGPATLIANAALSASGTGTITFAGGIGQSGGTWGLTKNGNGLLVLPVADTFGGGVTLRQGTLALGDPGAAGSGTLVLNGGTLQANGGPVALANAVTLNGNVTFAGANNLTFTGPATLTGNRNLTFTNTGTTTFAGSVGQSGGTYSMTIYGPGQVALSGSNTFGGGLTLNSGTLAVGNAAALGTGTLNLSGGSIAAAGGPVSLANAVKLNGNVTFAGANDLTFTGPATLTANHNLTVTNTGNTTFAAGIGQQQQSKLTELGTGVLLLSGTSTYTGGTAVNGGTLLVNGSLAAGTVTVGAGGTLGGSGTTGAVTVSSGGTVFPAAGATGVLSTGNATFASGSSFNAVLDGTGAGTGYDQLNVTGTVNLGNSTLNLMLGFTPLVGTAFTLINNNGTGAVVGTFKGLPEGATLTVQGMTFQITYVGGTGHSVVLTRIA